MPNSFTKLCHHVVNIHTIPRVASNNRKQAHMKFFGVHSTLWKLPGLQHLLHVNVAKVSLYCFSRQLSVHHLHVRPFGRLRVKRCDIIRKVTCHGHAERLKRWIHVWHLFQPCPMQPCEYVVPIRGPMHYYHNVCAAHTLCLLHNIHVFWVRHHALKVGHLQPFCSKTLFQLPNRILQVDPAAYPLPLHKKHRGGMAYPCTCHCHGVLKPHALP